MRPDAYKDADCVLVCFSVDNPDSLDSITNKWEPEIRRFCPKEGISTEALVRTIVFALM